MSRKRKYSYKLFESANIKNDTSANICLSMLMSEAWQQLSAKQQQLYLYCKAQYYGQRKKDRPQEYDGSLEYFTFNKSKWCDLYGLYSKNDDKGFIRDMSALIEYGFIKCVRQGALQKKKNIYCYSDKWRLYGTDKFEILPSEKTVAMLGNRKQK